MSVRQRTSTYFDKRDDADGGVAVTHISKENDLGSSCAELTVDVTEQTVVDGDTDVLIDEGLQLDASNAAGINHGLALEIVPKGRDLA